MAHRCLDGGECEGCLNCQEEETLAHCAECGRELTAQDRVVVTGAGQVLCEDTDCLYDFAITECDEDMLRDFASNFIHEFLELFQWEIFEAATHRGRAFWEGGEDPLVVFAQDDKACFVTYWLDEAGYFSRPLGEMIDNEQM